MENLRGHVYMTLDSTYDKAARKVCKMLHMQNLVGIGYWRDKTFGEKKLNINKGEPQVLNPRN